MNNGDMPVTAFTRPPTEAELQAYAGRHVPSVSYDGLTKREHFAGLAMQGLLSCDAFAESTKKLSQERRKNPSEIISGIAVEFADALLAALEES